MKKTNIIFKSLGMAAFALSALTFSSCLGDGDDTIILENGSSLGIPSDNLADAAPEVTEPTVTLPNAVCTLVEENGSAVMNIDMTGVWNANEGDWMNLYGTAYKGHGQNVWVTVDGKPKGIDVYNNSENEGREILTDVVFLVDNSGSMSEEAEAIARDMKEWAEMLIKSGLNVRFGCVGYGVHVGANDYSMLIDNYGISGALNISEYEVFNEYLNGRSVSGTRRTVGYYGSDSQTLQGLAALPKYSKAGGECGIQAFRFADENFSFRKGANRIYVNFTDDANYHGNSEDLKVSYLKNGAWTPNKGTIHTVFSGSDSFVLGRAYGDAPWLMSEYTGGSVQKVRSDFSDASLATLPVTGALQNSYIIRFTNVEEYMDGQPHEVKVTVVSADGTVKAEKIYWVIFQ